MWSFSLVRQWTVISDAWNLVSKRRRSRFERQLMDVDHLHSCSNYRTVRTSSMLVSPLLDHLVTLFNYSGSHVSSRPLILADDSLTTFC